MKTSRPLIMLGLVLTLIACQTNEAYAQSKRNKAKKEHRASDSNNNRARNVKKAERTSTKRRTTGVNRSRRHHRQAHYQYRHHPRRGHRVAVAPKGGRYLTWRGVRYTYADGIYYKPINGEWIVVVAPRGVRVRVLPPKRRRIVIAGSSIAYYYYYGTYYAEREDDEGEVEYEAVVAPLGAQVDALPEGYEEIEIAGESYYVLDGIYYKEVVTGEGDCDVYYEVVSKSTKSKD